MLTHFLRTNRVGFRVPVIDVPGMRGADHLGPYAHAQHLAADGVECPSSKPFSTFATATP